MEQKKSISLTILAALFFLCLLAMSIQSMTAQNDDPAAKDSEIADLKHEIEILKSERDLKKAGLNQYAVNVLILLLFSAATGLISAYFVKRRTRSFCHCNNRRLKQLKKIALENKKAALV